MGFRLDLWMSFPSIESKGRGVPQQALVQGNSPDAWNIRILQPFSVIFDFTRQIVSTSDPMLFPLNRS